ncbi:MAG: hypothetical protein V4760_19800 [Bdellovibrionota bacterium]
MKALVAALALAFPFVALAQNIPTQPEAYLCEIILATDDVPVDQTMWQFEVRAQGASHGGDAQQFTAGTHVIDSSADGHWLTLVWTKAGKLVAQGLFVMAPTDVAQHRVVILFNPDGLGEQVSLGCAAK